MKKFLLGSALILMSAGMASAADMPVKAPPAPAPQFSWSGFYIGGHAGYGWGHYEASDNLTVSPTQFFNLQPHGWFGGAQVGYNSQFARNWLLGMEIDVSGADISRSGTEQPVGGPAQAKVDYFGTARTRFGYVMNRLLVYATGGVAWTHDKYSWALPGPLTLANDRQFHVGWTIGGGIEYALDPRWSLKLEYLYADFRTNTIERAIPPALSRTADLNLSTVKVGVNYRLGDPDTASSAMPTKAVASRSIWNGGYIGVHGGYGWGSLHVTDGILGFLPVETANLDPKGWFGGFQGGYNWQFAPAWLVGLEADSSFGSLRDSGVTQPSLFAASTKIDELGTGRLRLGYVMDRMLVYATGGVAYGHEDKTLITSPSPGVATKVYHVGWAAGGGVEYKLDQSWSVKAEYLWTDLGKFDATRPAFPAQVRTMDLTVNTVKVGLNYSGPVIERLFAGR